MTGKTRSGEIYVKQETKTYYKNLNELKVHHKRLYSQFPYFENRTRVIIFFLYFLD